MILCAAYPNSLHGHATRYDTRSGRRTTRSAARMPREARSGSKGPYPTTAQNRLALPLPSRQVRANIVKRGDAKRDRIYCAIALLDILEEPARLKPAANRHS